MCQFKSENQYLTCTLDSYAMQHVKHLTEIQTKKGEEIKNALAKNYDLPIPDYYPVNSGSLAKSTAINSKFDLDIVVPFPVELFDSLEQMVEAVGDFFEHEYKDSELVRVRPHQTWSIGLMFRVLITGKLEEINIHVVLGREVQRDQYPSNGMLWLKNTCEGGRIKTNLNAQKMHLQNRHTGVVKVIRLLKVWKTSMSDQKLKSFQIELLVVKAFERAGSQVPKGIWSQLKMVLEYIRDHPKGSKLIDPGNSQNHLQGILTEDQWANQSHTVTKMLANIQKTPERMREYFPDNMNYCLKARY